MERRGRHRLARARHHVGGGDLAEPRIGHADDERLGDGRMAHEERLDLRRRYHVVPDAQRLLEPSEEEGVPGRVLDGEVRALVTANRISEILAALRLQREFGLDLVLDGAAEAYLVLDEIRAAGVPVIVHPTMARHTGTMENATYEAAKLLHDAGIPFALQSGFEGYVPKTRVVLFEAAMAAAYGLGFEDALRSITIDAATVIGQADRVGSIEAGKDGDLALFDGDPFEYTTRVCGVILDGRVVSEECR